MAASAATSPACHASELRNAAPPDSFDVASNPEFLREGTAVTEVCRKAGISEGTYYVWRKKFGGLMPSEMKRLKQLEEENGKLKRIVADLALDKEMLQDVIKRKL